MVFEEKQLKQGPVVEPVLPFQSCMNKSPRAGSKRLRPIGALLAPSSEEL